MLALERQLYKKWEIVKSLSMSWSEVQSRWAGDMRLLEEEEYECVIKAEGKKIFRLIC